MNYLLSVVFYTIDPQTPQTAINNILNDFESVNFVQSEKLRCMSRHQNPSMVSPHDGHLNLAQSGHYNFATTGAVRPRYVMVNPNRRNLPAELHLAKLFLLFYDKK